MTDRLPEVRDEHTTPGALGRDAGEAPNRDDWPPHDRSNA